MNTISHLKRRSLTLSGHRTSLALEPEFWAALSRVAQREDISLARLISRVDATREPHVPLASALRVFALSQALEARVLDRVE